MDKKMTIAGVVLTLNEEQDLERALASLAWCDELLVVDSGSTDNTFEVAKSCGARFLEHLQEPPFEITEQRNWALSNADLRSDWVLFLDADEEVSSDLRREILSCIESPCRVDAYELTPRYWFLGKWLKKTQGYPNWHPRLVRRGKAYFEGGVWETFSKGIEIDRISQPYEHYAFSKGLDDWLKRHQRYADWDAKEIVSYLDRNNKQSIRTQRWRTLRVFLARLWWVRPLLRFLQKYFLQGGFLEGRRSLIFCLMMSTYDLMVVVKVIEINRKSRNLPL